MEKTKGIRAEAIITRLYVPHLDGEICFAYPAKGPDTYANVASQLKQSTLQRPTTAQNASLIHTAWQSPKEQYSSEIIQILRNNWLWCYNGILYVPKEGAFIQDNPEIKNNEIIMDKSELVKRLETNDKSVRFVPFGYKIGEQSPKELAKNLFVIALAGEEGAEKLAETASNYKYGPRLYSFDKVDNPLIRVPALSGGRYLDEGLYVEGYSFGGLGSGYAFGVSDAGEASAQKFSGQDTKIDLIALERAYQLLGEFLGKR